MDFEVIATGLQFPEGPIAMPDGSIVLVEVARGTLSRVWNGRTTCNRPVNFVDTTGRNYLGQFLMVKIVGATSLSLQGELIHDAAFAERNDGEVKYTASYTQSEVVQ